MFFRAQSFDQAWAVTTAMLGVASAPADMGLDADSILTTRVVLIALLVAHWSLRNSSLEDAVARCPWWMRALFLALMLIALVHTPGEDRAFLYFQF